MLAISCTRHSGKSDAQLAARVGSYEITQYQVDTAVATIPNLKQDNLLAAKQVVVSRLVDRQLLVQKAQALKLDRTPQILAAIDTARQDIIAKAYVAQIVGALPQPTDSEVKRYYEDHPELFSGRKIYSLREVRVQSPNPADSAKAVSAATSSKSIEDVTQSLHEKGIPFSLGNVTRAAESLPLAILPALAQAKDGTILAFPIPGGAYVAQIVNTRAAPVDQSAASPNIRRFLLSQRERPAVDEALETLKKNEKIEYFGEYKKLKDHPESLAGASSAEVPAAPASAADAETKP